MPSTDLSRCLGNLRRKRKHTGSDPGCEPSPASPKGKMQKTRTKTAVQVEAFCSEAGRSLPTKMEKPSNLGC